MTGTNEVHLPPHPLSNNARVAMFTRCGMTEEAATHPKDTNCSRCEMWRFGQRDPDEGRSK